MNFSKFSLKNQNPVNGMRHHVSRVWIGGAKGLIEPDLGRQMRN